VAVLLYPSSASWLDAREHAADVRALVAEVADLPRPEKAAMLAQAHAYNAVLPAVPLGGTHTGAGLSPHTPGIAEYREALGATSAMAHLEIPRIGVEMPVYHGTDEQTLAQGVGHLFGTSLPVGGPDTHAVLTAHSGVVGTTLFDALHELERGDRFTVHVLDEVLTYEVDQILTVEPSDTDALRIARGEDYVTLVTCTPIGVNSHRLLVRGTRVENPPATGEAATVPAPAASGAFPWWTLGLLAVPAAIGVRAACRRGGARSRGASRAQRGRRGSGAAVDSPTSLQEPGGHAH
jgi:sortase A